jgi:ABC-type transport system substrate-binding protein
VSGTRTVWKANPDYYRTRDEGGRPGFDTFEQIIIGDRASSLAAYLSGQVHKFSGILPQEEPQIKSSKKDAQWYLSPGPTSDLFNVNMQKPQFKDLRVSKAFQLAMDYKGMGDAVKGPKGWTWAAITHLFPEAWTAEEISKLPGYNTATKQQDQAEAVKLLDAAGYKDGAGMKFDLETSRALSDDQVWIKDTFTKLWPRIDIKVFTKGDYTGWTRRLVQGDFEARVDNHTSVGDQTLDIRTYWHSESIQSGRNYFRYSQPWADAAMDKLLELQTVEERKAVVQPMIQRIENEGPPFVLLRHPTDYFVLDSNVGGYDMSTGAWAYPSYPPSRRWLWQTA